MKAVGLTRYLPITDPESLRGLLKKAASGILAIFPYSRTAVYAPRAKMTVALLDGFF